MPKVSICLPNLNTAGYLSERLDSILNQSFKDWECVVSDNYSNDGAWEIFKHYATLDQRIQLQQAERDPKGMYVNWNNCIRRATGEYIYFATSDDTMSPDCLEKLVAALDEHSECDLAHCCATFIDENSNPLDWKWETWPSVAYFGDLIKTKHIRPAGHDCVLACALTTPYYSITQLLIRRSLFEKAGLFETRWGSMGDLEWQMRATLLAPTVHIPEHLATWRKHPEQASQMNKFYQAQDDGWFIEMADAAIAFSKMKKSPTPNGLPRRLRRFFLFNQLYPAWNNLPGIAARVGFLSKRFFSDPHGVVLFLKDYPRHRRGQRRDLMKEVQEELAALGLKVCND